MLDYSGIPCPACGKAFTEDDDIVVCPECGAPYHRSCYAENGKCIFDDLHEKKEAWQAPTPPAEESDKPPVYEIKDKECPVCGSLNAHSAIFCTHCNASLSGNPPVHDNRQNGGQNSEAPTVSSETDNQNPQMYGSMFGMPIMVDPMAGIKPTEQIDDNISYGDVSKVIQQGTRYYIPIFNRIKLINKSKFNFSACLFSGGWMLYRKMYKPGIIVSLLMFLLFLGQQFLTVFVSYPVLLPILKEAGVDVSTQLYLTAEQSMSMVTTLMDAPSKMLLVMLPMICYVIMFVIMIISGAKANRMYMKHCVTVIKKTRETSNNNEDYETAIRDKGGVNTSIAVCVLICYFLCSYLPSMLLF